MPSFRVLNVFCVSMLVPVCYAGFARGEEPVEEIHVDAPKGWRGERIELPPSFAPNMELKGVEEVRFSEGMFRPESKDFFSYVIVFRLDGQPRLSQQTLEQELLAYYRGLAKAVGRGKIKTDGFSIEVKPDRSSKAKNAREYIATLEWTEPFATKKPQTLRIEIRVWGGSKNRRTWAFMSVSPNSTDDPIWKKMHKVRDNFFKSSEASTVVKQQ